MQWPASEDLFGFLEGNQPTRTAIIRRTLSLEKTVTEKPTVVDMLSRSFEEVRQSIATASEKDFERTVDCFGEGATIQRVCLRMLVHMHEHMGQAVAYARSNGIRVPWPDPLAEV